jgi:hypothetical protein
MKRIDFFPRLYDKVIQPYWREYELEMKITGNVLAKLRVIVNIKGPDRMNASIDDNIKKELS